VGDNCLCLKAKPHSISYIGSVKLYWNKIKKN
jgi:hypothetical protein